MALTYVKDDGSATAILDQLYKLFHQPLSRAGVTVEILHCHGGLKHAGYSAAATVKINSLKDRAAGCADARIVVDGDGWADWDRKRRQAVLDHEATHLEVVEDSDGAVVRDDLGRPKLKMRLHDHQLGVFEDVARRNKEHSVDAQVMVRAWRSMEQLEIDWETAYLLANVEGSAAEVGA